MIEQRMLAANGETLICGSRTLAQKGHFQANVSLTRPFEVW